MNKQQPGSGGIHVDLKNNTSSAAGTQENASGVFPIPNDISGRIKTLTDLALCHITIEQFPVVKEWRRKLFDPEFVPEVCDELPRLLTEYMAKTESASMHQYTRRANAINYIFSNKTATVKETDLLPGQTTTSFVGPVVYADTIGYCIWPELKTLNSRRVNPTKIRPEVADRLNKEIFPYWLNRKTVQEVARYSDYDTDSYQNNDRVNSGKLSDGTPSIDPPLKKKAGETPRCQELLERVAFYLSDKATCVSHTTPDFENMLKYGLNGLIKKLQEDVDNGIPKTDEQRIFLEGVIAVFEGANKYAEHLAVAAAEAGNVELERICRKVPSQPAETLHEALAAIWICYHLILQENTNFGMSFGRLDQLLNPYYMSDWEKLSTTQEKEDYTAKAVEMVCHFFLHSCDHVPLSTEGAETLFAGSGSNQALTVGGTRIENGEIVDAVNDMTYVILKTTELLAVRDPNVHVRFHKDIHNGNAHDGLKYNPYLMRISQVNILTRATPAIHGDAPVTKAMADYYGQHEGVSEDEALADAYDYSSIGCIEQNSTGKHYGNSGSTLFVIPAVLELALFGGKHRSSGVDDDGPNLFTGKIEYTTKPLTKMKSMKEFIDAFRSQLDEMARHAVQNNNYLGRSMEKVRPSPFLSGLYVGPINTPESNGASFKDVSSGGAKYNSSGVAIIGVADVIDSFCVIDSLLFKGEVTNEELIAAMMANFEEEKLSSLPGDLTLTSERLRVVNEKIKLAPKYGAGVELNGKYDNKMAVDYTHLITKMIQDVFYKYRNHRGGRYLAGYWSMTNHAGFGMLAQALPNGRKSGAPFASGITPCSGIVKRDGSKVNALDHIRSVASVDANTVQNGYTYNLSLTTQDKSHFREDTEKFAGYMKAFIDEDGVLVQLCVASIKELEAAHNAVNLTSKPEISAAEREAAIEPFKDLMIRVAGYSAYFVSLNSQMRQEIIARSNFALKDGEEQHPLR
jgi:formate C-acetyltransferase